MQLLGYALLCLAMQLGCSVFGLAMASTGSKKPVVAAKAAPATAKPTASKNASKKAAPPPKAKKDEEEEEPANKDCFLKPGVTVDKRWTVVRKLGEGNFGAVYEATDALKEIKDTVALKLESRKADKDDQVLKIEVAVLDAMKAHPKHACKLYDMGRNEKFNYMVMSLLGPSLSILRKFSKDQKFSQSTAIRILLQAMESLKDLHLAGWIHRDIKPSNFAMGHHPRKRRLVYLFDFGLARLYALKEKGKLVVREKRDWLGFRGTMRYCSINTHKRLEVGRHDDLIGLLYAFVEMAGKLPWKDLDEDKEVAASKEKNTNILYKDMPDKLFAMHVYLHTLKYEDKPNYRFLEETLLEIVEEKGYHNQPFDWEKTKEGMRFWNTATLPMESSQSNSLS